MTTQENLEILLFDEAVRKVQVYLKIIGLQIDDHFRNRSIWKRRLWFSINISCICLTLLSQLTWFVQNASTGKNFIQHTNVAPCFALCVLSSIQSFYLIKHSRQICELVESIRDLQAMIAENELNENDRNFLKSQMKIFYIAVNGLTAITIIGLIGFAISPIVTIVNGYYSTGELKLILPFLLAFPFDTNDIRFWSIAFIFEMWAAILAVLTVLTPGFLCYACSTFIIFQFRVLHKDLERVIPFRHSLGVQIMDEEFKRKLMNIIDRHGKLIACVDLMEFVYSESTLFNVVTSTLLICLTGFNVTTIKDLTLVVPFLQFLMMSLVQIYFLCYYGDKIMIYSMRVADAAFNSQWYRAEMSIVKDLMIISARARKPCKMTALRYSDVNFKTFTKILSSSWSYFALLTTLYRE